MLRPPPAEAAALTAHLKDLLAGHLYATVSRLRLLQGQLVAEQLQLVHQVPFVAGRHISLPAAAAHSAVTRVVTPDIHGGSLGGLLHLGLLAGEEEESEMEKGSAACDSVPDRHRASAQTLWGVYLYLMMVCRRGSVNCVVLLLWSTK